VALMLYYLLPGPMQMPNQVYNANQNNKRGNSFDHHSPPFPYLGIIAWNNRPLLRLKAYRTSRPLPEKSERKAENKSS